MPDRKTQFDSKLLIYRLRQITFGFIIAITIGSFTFYIQDGFVREHSLSVILFPLILISFLFILFPPTEEWEYKPWQSKATRVEQRSSGR